MALFNRCFPVILCVLCAFTFINCARFDPKQTFTPEQLKADFGLMRQGLEEAHPGLYRYTSHDSMNLIFDQTLTQLNRPMTEREFRRTVNPIFSLIRCGHTDIYSSKGSARYYKKNKPKEFPINTYFLQNKLWVYQNRTDDSTIKAGMEVVEIDGRAVADVVADIRKLLPSDGYNQSFKNTLIAGNFGGQYRYLVGEKEDFKVTLKDSTGKLHKVILTYKKPPKPTKPPKTPPATTKPTLPEPKAPKIDQRRNLTFSDKDSTTAILDINTFKDGGYRRFYKKAFRKIAERGTKNLIIDLRANGGGRSDASVNLMSYVIEKEYVVYDSVTAKRAKPSAAVNRRYGWRPIRFMASHIWGKKRPDGSVWYRVSGKVNKPSKKYNYKGNVYILTNGGSFSASAIFTSVARLSNPKVVTVGRETGGGRHGCNAMISPYITLPNTRAKVRMPMFKILLRVPGADIGRGVMPDFPVEYSIQDVLKNREMDLDKVYELVNRKNANVTNR